MTIFKRSRPEVTNWKCKPVISAIHPVEHISDLILPQIDILFFFEGLGSFKFF